MNAEQLLKTLKPEGALDPQVLKVGKRTKLLLRDEGLALRHGNDARPLTERGQDTLLATLALPKGLARRLPDDLGLKVANHLLSKKERLTIIGDGATIQEVLPAPKHVAMDPERVMRELTGVVGHEVDFEGAATDRHEHLIYAVGAREVPVVRGDMIRAGVHVAYSPMGVVGPSAQAYCVRLTCTNGATSQEFFKQWTGHGEGDEIWQEFRQGMRSAYNGIDGIIAEYHRLREERVPPREVAARVEALIRRFKMPNEVAQAFHARVMNDPPRNMYQLYNHITWLASHAVSDPTVRRGIMDGAAAVSRETRRVGICAVCGGRHMGEEHANRN